MDGEERLSWKAVWAAICKRADQCAAGLDRKPRSRQRGIRCRRGKASQRGIVQLNEHWSFFFFFFFFFFHDHGSSVCPWLSGCVAACTAPSFECRNQLQLTSPAAAGDTSRHPSITAGNSTLCQLPGTRSGCLPDPGRPTRVRTPNGSETDALADGSFGLRTRNTEWHWLW